MGYIKDLMTLSHGEAYCDELFHFGIKGMKWGVRRYQNADGSLTPAGEKRYYGKANAIQRDIDSFKPHKNGIKNKRGKTVLTKEEVAASVRGLEGVRDKARAKGDARRKKDYAKLQRITAAGKKRHYGDDIVRNYRQNKLNRETKKFFTLDGGYKKLDKIMRDKGPMAYGRWYASGNTAQARREINRLHKHTSKLLNKYGKKYKIVYDVMTEQYHFQPKN